MHAEINPLNVDNYKDYDRYRNRMPHARKKQNGNFATPERPFGKRWQKGRHNCPLCGYPMSNDIDADGNRLGYVCMTSKCENHGKIMKEAMVIK